MKMKNKNLKNVGALIILLLAVIAAILIVCKYRLDKKESAQPVTIGQGKRKICAVSGYNKQL